VWRQTRAAHETQGAITFPQLWLHLPHALRLPLRPTMQQAHPRASRAQTHLVCKYHFVLIRQQHIPDALPIEHVAGLTSIPGLHDDVVKHLFVLGDAEAKGMVASEQSKQGPWGPPKAPGYETPLPEPRNLCLPGKPHLGHILQCRCVALLHLVAPQRQEDPARHACGLGVGQHHLRCTRAGMFITPTTVQRHPSNTANLVCCSHPTHKPAGRAVSGLPSP
jgi:hypothetical protein